MSEKRYTFECIENNCLIYEDGIWLKIEEVVNLLNEFETKCYKLEKVNERLKETNEKLQRELDKTREDLNYFSNLKVGSNCGHDRFYITSMQKKR